ncbi:MAG: hypothetical protein ACO3I0_08865 [Limisphaerales bacterium]
MKATLRDALFWGLGLGIFLLVEAQAQAPIEPILRVESEPAGVRLEATCPASTRRVVWESTDHLDGGLWNLVAVDVTSGPTVSRVLTGSETQRFLRVRALETPGFNGRVDRIVRAVRDQWREAILLEASSIPGTLVETYPDEVTLRVVLQVEGGTVVVDETDWTQPVSPEFRPMPWMGSARLPWPVAMDELEAEAVYRAAGHGPEFGAVTLRQPIYPGMTEPYFIFRTPAGPFVFVGTVTRKVKTD